MLQEFERTRETNQSVADRVSADLFQSTSDILTQQGVSKRKIISAIRAGLAGPMSFVDPNTLSMDELLNIRELSKDVDFNDDGVKKVTLNAYGWDKKKNQPHRTFVFVKGLPHFVELRRDHAVMWDIQTRGKRTFAHRGGRADLQEINFYKQVVNKL